MYVHVTDIKAKVWLKVLTQIKTLGDAIGMIWPQLLIWVSHVAMVTMIMIVTYNRNFFY